jgi:alpha-glucosidase
MNFTCTVTSNAIEIAISRHEGSFIPWWKNIRVEVYGWTPASGKIQQDGRNLDLPIERGKNFIAISVPDPGTGTSLKLE